MGWCCLGKLRWLWRKRRVCEALIRIFCWLLFPDASARSVRLFIVIERKFSVVSFSEISQFSDNCTLSGQAISPVSVSFKYSIHRLSTTMGVCILFTDFAASLLSLIFRSLFFPRYRMRAHSPSGMICMVNHFSVLGQVS